MGSGPFASNGSAASSTSFSPSMGFGQMGMGGMGGGMMGMGGMGMPGCMDPMGGLGMMGGMPGGNEAMFKAALQSSLVAGSSSQLHLLLPNRLLQQALVPQGHLAEIANKCQIRIDLGQEVQPDLRQVTLCGGVAANSVAAYFLQERALQHGAM